MITTITLELVRHGALHNQLLSPLTPYIALAGNRPAETVYVPVEHAQMLAKLRRLRYDGDREAETLTREAYIFRATSNLREASQVVTRFLETIRGLSEAISEAMAERESHHSGEPDVEDLEDANEAAVLAKLIRLKLVVSANELAMLPFELAQGPLTLGGSDMLSALRPPPIVITRESRRFAYSEFQFRSVEEYKVLVIAADPQRRGLPLRGVMQALRRAYPAHAVTVNTGRRARAEGFQQYVHVLVDASLEEVREKIALNNYSHVLVLAHGEMPEALDAQPMVLLHSGHNKRNPDRVSAERLAAALCAPRATDGTKHRKPLFVSLMVCDSGAETRAPLFAGGSIAHTIHESGVPFVVASQFPVTFAGAALATECLFRRLLENRHPTAAVAETRRRLFVELGDTHDWASLVVYLSLPDDGKFDAEVRERRFEVLLADLYIAFRSVEQKQARGTTAPDASHDAEVFSTFEKALAEAKKAFKTIFEGSRASQARERHGGSASPARDRWPTYAGYAALIANASLRQARALGGDLEIWRQVKASDGPVARHHAQRIREALLEVVYYCRAHLYFGGRTAETYVHMTLVLELLATEERRDAVKKWWWVADWRLVDDAMENSNSDADIFFLGTKLIHLLLGRQLDVEDRGLEQWINKTVDKIAFVYERNSHEEWGNMIAVQRRLRRCRKVWWAPNSRAVQKLDAIEGRWRALGIPDLEDI